MKNIVLAIGILFTSLFTNLVYAMPPSLVVDNASLFSEEEKSKLTAQIMDLYKRTGAQLVVVTVPDLGDSTIEDYTLNLGREWKLGTAKDNNGLIVAVAMKQRKTRIEVGYGLEGSITDAQAKHLLVDMREPLKNKQYFKAFSTVIASIDSTITKNQLPKDETVKEEGSNDGWIILLVICLFGLGMFSFWYFMLREDKKEDDYATEIPERNYSSRKSNKSSSSGFTSGLLTGIVLSDSYKSRSSSSESSSSSSSSSSYDSGSSSSFGSDGGSFGGGGSSDSF